MRSSFRYFYVVFALSVFAVAACFGESGLHRWTNLDWTHKDFPLFTLLGPFEKKPDLPTIAKEVRQNKSPLNVHDFREVILAADEKGITVSLNDEDARVLKTFAPKGESRWFIAVAPPKEIVAGHPALAVVSVTPSNGQIVFRHPESASVAQNLRHRFRIAEFRLTPR